MCVRGEAGDTISCCFFFFFLLRKIILAVLCRMTQKRKRPEARGYYKNLNEMIVG